MSNTPISFVEPYRFLTCLLYTSIEALDSHGIRLIIQGSDTAEAEDNPLIKFMCRFTPHSKMCIRDRHECCNYDEGNCLLLDDGEPCVCVQSISLSLMCRWFRVAVLPLSLIHI